MHYKDLIIGLLVAYLVISLIAHVLTGTQNCLSTLMASGDGATVAVVLAVGVAAGALAFYLARNSKELDKDLRKGWHDVEKRM